MADPDSSTPLPLADGAPPTGDGRPLEIERRDFTALVHPARERVQSLAGFDDVYTDIVDYIVRCTHRIWDERDVGLIYTHYTHNCGRARQRHAARTHRPAPAGGGPAALPVTAARGDDRPADGPTGLAVGALALLAQGDR